MQLILLVVFVISAIAAGSSLANAQELATKVTDVPGLLNVAVLLGQALIAGVVNLGTIGLLILSELYKISRILMGGDSVTDADKV